jgi:hypothetical protein
MNIGTHDPDPDPDPPYDPSDDGLNRNVISNTVDNGGGDKGDNEDEDGDSDAVDGPTIDAYVDLAKTACKYYFSGYCPMHILLRLQCAKFILKLSLLK